MEISVIITAWNRQEFLHEALESLNRQEYSRDEFGIIIVSNFNLSNNIFQDFPDLTITHIREFASDLHGHYLYPGI